MGVSGHNILYIYIICIVARRSGEEGWGGMGRSMGHGQDTQQHGRSMNSLLIPHTLHTYLRMEVIGIGDAPSWKYSDISNYITKT